MKEYNIYFEATVLYDDEERTECGFVPADNFVDAMTTIEGYFGNQLCDIKMHWMDGGLITMEKQTAKQVLEFNGVYGGFDNVQ